MGLIYPSALASLPVATFKWLDDTGALIDFSSGWTFVLKIGRTGDPAPTVTKSAGIAGAATDPNVTVAWDADELAVLSDGDWTLQIAATRTADNLTRYLRTDLTIGSTNDTGDGTATYSGDPTHSLLDQVRYLLGDTDITAPFLTDLEIQFELQTFPNPLMAASACAEDIAATLGAKVDGSKTVGGLAIAKQYTAQATRFTDLAKRLKRRAFRLKPPMIQANPDALGAEFQVGMFDVFSFDGDATTFSDTQQPPDWTSDDELDWT